MNEQFPTGIENQEQQPQLPVFIVYRDNATYRELIPVLLQKMEQAGRKVEIKSFPAATPDDEIKSYLEQDAVKAQMAESELLMDHTSQRQIDVKDKIMARMALDRLSSDVLRLSFLGKEYVPNKTSFDTEAELFRYQMHPLKRAVELFIAKHPETQNIYIAKNKSADHGLNAYFEEGLSPDIAEMDDESILREILNPDSKYYSEIASEYVHDIGSNPEDVIGALKTVNEDDDGYKKYCDSIAANYIKQNLLAVTEGKNVEIVDDITAVPLAESDLVIFDTHHAYDLKEYFAEHGVDYKKQGFSAIHKNTLPVMLDNVQQIANIIDVSDFKIEENIEEQVQKYFEKK